MARALIPAHTITRHLLEIVNDPAHGRRSTSAIFRASKKRLRADGHWQCWICGTTRHLEVHHYGLEWMFAAVADWAALKAFCEEWDVYGYGHLLRHQPMTSVDDIRNCMVLCREHHRGGPADGAANGTHNITFSAWVSPKLVRADAVTVPQDADPTDGV